MASLQATWLSHGALFFWSTRGGLEDAARRELPRLDCGSPSRELLAIDGDRRRKMSGCTLALLDAAETLVEIDEATTSDVVRCWSRATLLALELAGAQRVVPTVREGQARWAALLTREQDQQRFEALVAALPVVGRAAPLDQRGKVRLMGEREVVRAYVDGVIDAIYRTEAHPGPARGWALEFSAALVGRDARFSPRDAHFQGIPERLAGWSTPPDHGGFEVWLRLTLPRTAKGSFGLGLQLVPANQPEAKISLEEAWAQQPYDVLRALARASRIFPPLADTLKGSVPTAVRWTAEQAWQFLSAGVPSLRDAGFRVAIPSAFSRTGRQRLHARMRFGEAAGGVIDLDQLLCFHWEVVLGERVLDSADFSELLALGCPISFFRGQWILLDPADLALLTSGLPTEGDLPAVDALRAVLAGEHNGVPVVADDRLALVIQALRDPPPQQVPVGLQGTLRPYQRRGYDWLSALGDLGLGACLADDMGLGKTIQLIAHLLRRQHHGPSLVVCPTSVFGNWARELHKFAPSLRVCRHHGASRETLDVHDIDVVVTTYGLLVRDLDTIEQIDWNVVALDEAQAIKNPDARRARAARGLQAKHRVALTGTPVENRLDELWSLMQFLVPGLLGPRATFRRTVAVPVERFGDTEVADRLKRGVAPFLLRRLKRDPGIVQDLPDKLECKLFVPLSPEQADLYQDVVDEALERISDADDVERRGQVLAMLTKLKQVCNHPAHYLKDDGRLMGRSVKLDRVMELVERITDTGERVLIFTQFKVMGQLLQRAMAPLFGEVPFLYGATLREARDRMVRAFQEQEDVVPILLVSLKAGGTGLNLTRATHVIHFDRWWNPAVEDQATDRAHRIGQHNQVQVHKLVCQGTLEERIDIILEEKRALAEAVVGAGESWVGELDDDALRALVQLGDDAVAGGW